ncbi:Uncharacterised protein [Chryseobacterium carnipullorum]|uniref:Uncharacterized protein n=1 Tax=Chryseobacterium carnipullorum TaxID=1124835 RepID=A0A376EG52_CHRCU|nr:Uncharacterised protein [Chryseobacterium carnipullorum]
MMKKIYYLDLFPHSRRCKSTTYFINTKTFPSFFKTLRKLYDFLSFFEFIFKNYNFTKTTNSTIIRYLIMFQSVKTP